ncbi:MULTISPECIES: hypothetical protein [Kosakonia]|jgi:phage regulator Rha-like protein|uniref:hypothetical protein n=1 Tax=Kosakonia TaxID=1330547 RepID=UPI002A6A211D|nr:MULTISPECIES: hypothetical protein [Kosakonia]MDY0890179.1 hypothetical protein [Kosakonia sp. CFBP8986]WRY60087.1 hypothetical protein P8F81_03435 [Kosakonia cowanii]
MSLWKRQFSAGEPSVGWRFISAKVHFTSEANAMKYLIKIVKGEPVVSTKVIATEFGRRHDNVMQNIRSLIETEHLGPLDFKESLYVNKQNKVQPAMS